MSSNSYRFILPSLLLAIGIAIAGLAIGLSIAHIKGFDRYVTVKGLAERKVEANEAIWQLDFNYSSDTLSDLYSGVAKSQKAIQTFLVDQGFSAQDVQTQPVTVTDNESNSYVQNVKMRRYKANASVVLMTNKIQTVLNAVQKTGSLVQSDVVISTSSVRYLFTQLNEIKPTMLNEATLNAQKAAETFAKNSNSQLDGIRQASQGLFTIVDTDGSYGGSDPVKKVRVVTTVQYFLK